MTTLESFIMAENLYEKVLNRLLKEQEKKDRRNNPYYTTIFDDRVQAFKERGYWPCCMHCQKQCKVFGPSQVDPKKTKWHLTETKHYGNS